MTPSPSKQVNKESKLCDICHKPIKGVIGLSPSLDGPRQFHPDCQVFSDSTIILKPEHGVRNSYYLCLENVERGQQIMKITGEELFDLWKVVGNWSLSSAAGKTFRSPPKEPDLDEPLTNE